MTKLKCQFNDKFKNLSIIYHLDFLFDLSFNFYHLDF